MKNKIIFICPYYTQKRTAASCYIDNIISRVPEEVDYILYCKQLKPSSMNAICLESLPIFNIIGYRLYAMILSIYFSTIKGNIVITDSNPIISLPFSDKIFHVIHHINDIPVLGYINKGTSYSDGSPPKNKFDIASVCWRILLCFSPRNIITVSNSEKNKIKKLFNRKIVHVIKNINQLEKFQFANLAKVCKHYKYDIIMIGHYVKRKNYGFALKVIEEASKLLDVKISLCIIGNDTHKIKDHIKSENVSIDCFSNLDRDEMLKNIALSRFYLNTSYLEGYCIPYIECQSLGLIPIVPNQEIFHENCFSKQVYFCEPTSISFTKSIYNAFNANKNKIHPSLLNIDDTKQIAFLNININAKIDDFIAALIEKKFRSS